MADVAHEAGVSVASVSNFLNKQPYMSEAMAARIAEAIDPVSYTHLTLPTICSV